LKLDISNVLDVQGMSEVVTANVDLEQNGLMRENPFKAPIRIKLKAENHLGVVSLDCVYDFTLSFCCDRCLSPVEREQTLHFSHTAVRSLAGSENEEFMVLPDGILELSQLAANDILPEMPMQFLCDENCKGLCPRCGHNRNLGECGCPEESALPKMNALSSFFE